jgi:ABC-type multidrug transport system fused ATPase/permease subunit
VALLALALVGSIGLQLMVPLIVRRFIDSALAGQAVPGLMAAGIAYLAAGIMNQVLSAVATFLGADVGWAATNSLREDLAHHLLGLDMGFYAETTPGEMIERVDGDVTAVANFLSRFMVRLLGSALLLAGVLVVPWFQDWRMGAVMGLYVILSLGVIARMRGLAVEASEVERETSARLYGFIEERLAGLDDIRANGGGPFTMNRFIEVMRDFYVRTVAAWRKRTIFWVTTNTVFWSGDAIALAVGVLLYRRGAISVGTAYLILQYVALVRTPIEQVAQEFQELQKAAGGIVRIDHLRRLRSRLDETGTRRLPAGSQPVEFDRVSFAYEHRPVLENVSFRLEAGSVLGLLGRTGGGKTTITRLIARLYDPDDGVVRLGNIDLRTVDPASLRSAVGVVTQDVQLFQATVRDNLTFFADRSAGDILAVLDRAGLGDWLRGVGLHTRLRAGGEGLSAGEAQLLAFARVFLQDPGIVILDEPSSRLDPATESLLQTATERLFSGRTVIIVAHRLETVRLADEIMVVDAGRVAEHGRREDLVADRDSRYARLLASGAGSELLGRSA